MKREPRTMGYKVLLTGFPPWHLFDPNPSGEIAKALDKRTIDGATVYSKVIPSAFDETPKAIRETLRNLDPDLIISMGLFPSAVALQVERVFVNLMDCDGVPDNKGNKPVDIPIVPGGPYAYAATIPVRKIVETLNRADIPAVISNSGMTHCCNLAGYTALHFIAENRLTTRAGFIHIPFTPHNVAQLDGGRPPATTFNTPSLPLAVCTKGVELAISTAIKEINR